jgi:hypothetical protein
MAEWRLRLEGDAIDLLLLRDSLIGGDLNVLEQHEEYFLRGNDLEVYEEAHDVLIYAESLLPIINGVLKVRDPASELVKSGGLSRHHEDGRREVFAFFSGIGRVRTTAATATLTGGVASTPLPGTTIASRFEIARRCPEVNLALRFFAAPPDWFNLYKVGEIIKHDMGTVKEIVDKGWCTKSDFDHFTASANNYHATGLQARHARLDWGPMKKPAMKLEEAQNFIQGLLEHWVRTKAE